MGIMSKNDRLPERPKPPSWDFISEDVQAAENHDVVFLVGKDNLNETAVSQRSSSAERNLNASSSNFNSSGATDSDLDTSNLDPAQVEASYNHVLRLISLYTDLKDAPENMQREFSHLKEKGAEITQSILELKTLAQTMSTQSNESKTSAKKSPGADGSSNSKGKSKQKKKK